MVIKTPNGRSEKELGRLEIRCVTKSVIMSLNYKKDILK